MTNDKYPRLCGGTFFTLVLQALKQRMKAREHYKGESDGLTDPDVLVGLIRVINPDYQEPAKGALKGKTNDYKSCKTSSGEYLPFGDAAVVEEFDLRVKNDYPAVLAEMTCFVNRFIEVGTASKKDIRLVKALIDLIQQDKNIDDTDEFAGLENGSKIKKAALGDLRNVCLPAFLLGIWHYVVVKCTDNKVGQATYDEWCPSAGRAQRVYKGNMGSRLQQEVKVYMPDGTSDTVEQSFEEDIQEEYSSEDTSTNQTPPPSAAPVYNNNPLFIQQNGDGNVVMPNYGTINITFGKK